MNKQVLKSEAKVIAKGVAQDVVTGLALVAVCLAIKKVSGVDVNNLKIEKEKVNFLDDVLKHKKK